MLANDNHLTTGAIAADMLNAIGLAVNFVGIHRPASFLSLDAKDTNIQFHYPALSREIGLFWRAGVYS